MSTFSCSAWLALRMRVSRSAIGSLCMAYQLAFTMPGTLALERQLAEAQAAHLELPEVAARPPAQPAAVIAPASMNFGVRCDFMMSEVLAIP